MGYFLRTLCIGFLVSLTFSSSVYAAYYDANQSLLFKASHNAPGVEWRVANSLEIDNLFGPDLWSGQPAAFRQQTADAIIGLGGSGTGPQLSCDPSFGIPCEDLQSLCELSPGFPACGSLEFGGDLYTLPSLAFDSDNSGATRFGDLYEISGTYTRVGSDWSLSLVTLAAPIDAWCEVDCNFPTIYVSEVPLPAGMPLMASALLGLFGLRKLR